MKDLRLICEQRAVVHMHQSQLRFNMRTGVIPALLLSYTVPDLRDARLSAVSVEFAPVLRVSRTKRILLPAIRYAGSLAVVGELFVDVSETSYESIQASSSARLGDVLSDQAALHSCLASLLDWLAFASSCSSCNNVLCMVQDVSISLSHDP